MIAGGGPGGMLLAYLLARAGLHKARHFRFRTPITTSDYGLLDTPYDYFSLRTRVLPRIPAQPIAAAARSRTPPRR
ncbi:hypothetical protein SAMN05216207_10845 [Pseudonocardia ammonioxydans]|uniref:Uncharacterized protein n=1 Tax=Pseudonocardia ammonioxydans TaxID=260086 RepID=A0A1I5I2E0_PSUAM|nr:hypothetical protein SAMN05216207_10845 [Pseudonocardia ammonioxydans]